MIRTRKEVWKAWIAAGLWLLLIVIESTDWLSSSHTGHFLYQLLKSIFGPIDLGKFYYWHGIARKLGHVIGYGVLSLLLFRAWQATLPLPGAPRWAWRWAQVAFFMTVLVASLDEWHQSFIPSRTGTWHDVVLDGAAAVGAQILLYLLLRGWRSQGVQEIST